jgi:ribosome-binding protein aMBF1 (putative translation factor)
MRFEGRLWKDGKFWVVEIPMLDLSTQGTTRKDAFRMARSVVEDVVGKSGFKVDLQEGEKNQFSIGSDDAAELIALMLKRQRAKHGMSLMEVAERMGSKSPNAFGAYEQGKREPTLSTLEKLIRVLDRKASLSLSLR